LLLFRNHNQFLLETIMKNTRKTLLITAAAAALLAGAGLASAQGTNENHAAPGAAAHDQKAPGGKMDHQPGSVSQKSPTPTAQAPTKEKPAPTAHAPMKEKQPAPTAQAPTKEKPVPTAHAPMKEKPGAAQAPGLSQPKTAGQGGVAQTSKSPHPRTAPTVARDETKSGAPAALSAEQHAKIWTTLRGEKAERLTNVLFSTTVGEIVPGTVHLYSLPVSILEYAPQYRDYEYILVGDEILIVDPRTLRIVAVIAA
jgi:Protein of unknown function (DUF1236)